MNMKSLKTVLSALVAVVGCGAFAVKTIDLTIPVESEKGFYILKTK